MYLCMFPLFTRFIFYIFLDINVCVVRRVANNIYYNSNSDVLMKRRRKKIECEVADVSTLVPLRLGCCFETVLSGIGYLFFAYLYLLLYNLVEKSIICINTPFHDHCKN